MPFAAAVLIILFLLITMFNQESANEFFSAVKLWLETNMSWFYILIVNVSFFVAAWLFLGRFGSIRLGGECAKPEYSRFSWFSMLFSAAVGIGLLFYSVAEPIFHFQSNPFLSVEGVKAESQEAADLAIRITFLHWGFHGWAIYALIGLCLAYFTYSKGLPLAIRSSLYPIFRHGINGWIGHTVDLLAAFGTVFGIATTLGLGVSQMNAGLNYLFGVDISTTNQIIITSFITIIATGSTVVGIDKGMKLLSEWNIRLTIVLLGFFILAGPTVYLVGLYVRNLGSYLANVVPMGLWVDPAPGDSWQGHWTLFYWGWWISWGPFVGMFIARISRGRTIKEFLVGAILAPSILAFLWLSIFGGVALDLELSQPGILKELVNADLTIALYRTIELLGVDSTTWFVALLATVLVVTWFVTSADSGIYVVCNIVTMGANVPTKKQRVFWGVSLGLVVVTLLLTGGLDALKNISIILAFPFSLVFLLMIFGLVSSLFESSRDDISSHDGRVKTTT